MTIHAFPSATAAFLARHWIILTRLTIVLLGIYLVREGFRKPLLTMPVMGEVFFHEDINGGEKKAQLILGLLAAGGIAGLLRARFLSGLLTGAGTAVFLASLETIHRVGMDRLETLGRNPMFRNSADIIAKGIQISDAPWIVGTGCVLIVIVGFLPACLRGARHIS